MSSNFWFAPINFGEKRIIKSLNHSKLGFVSISQLIRWTRREKGNLDSDILREILGPFLFPYYLPVKVGTSYSASNLLYLLLRHNLRRRLLYPKSCCLTTALLIDCIHLKDTFEDPWNEDAELLANAIAISVVIVGFSLLAYKRWRSVCRISTYTISAAPIRVPYTTPTPLFPPDSIHTRKSNQKSTKFTSKLPF